MNAVVLSSLGEALIDWFPFLSVLTAGISIHTVIYIALVMIIIYLALQKSYRPEEPVILTEKEIQECIDGFHPQPLFPELNEQEALDAIQPIVSSAADTKIVVNDIECINLASLSPLNFQNNPEVKATADATLRKYGPGSCGPRGFYGTMDLHLDFEDDTAKFFGGEGSIFYSSGLALLTSAISAYATRGDIIVCDDGIRHGIEMGNLLSRSLLYFFKHNDMDELENALKEAIKSSRGKLTRRWIVVEGVYFNSGDICKLNRVVELAKQYRFRMMIDETFAVGTLGKTGRGAIEHFNLNPRDFDLILVDVTIPFATVGGICVGRRKVTEHQRLAGSGYCFSASNPPYLVASGIKSLQMLREQPERVERVRQNAKLLRQLLSNMPGTVLCGDEAVPFMHLRIAKPAEKRIQDERLLQRIVDSAREQGVALTRAKYVHTTKLLPPPSIRVTVSCDHTEEQLREAAAVIRKTVEEELSRAADE